MANILECSTKGDKRFSAFYARIKMYGVENTIENFYQFNKVFRLPDGSLYQIKNIEELKGKNKRKDLKLIGFKINEKYFEVKYLTPYYQTLWIKYLDTHKELVEYAKQFDDYNDMFKGKNTLNCQADVIRQYIKQGRKSFFTPEMKEFISLLKQEHQVREQDENLFKSDVDIYAHQTNCMGYMGRGIALEIKNIYPKIYLKYTQICKNTKDKNKLFGRCLLLGEKGQILNKEIEIDYNQKIIANLFGQIDVSRTKKMTNEKKLKQSLQELKDFAQPKGLWIGIPKYIGCKNGGGDWDLVYSYIKEIFKDYPITLFDYDKCKK